MNNLPFIYLFNTPKHYYLYDVNTNLIVEINQETYRLLQSIQSEEDIEMVKQKNGYISQLINKGLLKSKRTKFIEHPDTEFVEDILNRKIDNMILQITQQCNLRCTYCVYSGDYNTRNHSNNVMSLQCAKESIDFLIMHSLDSKELSIGFYGGEPLLRFDFIKECIKYSKDQTEGKKLNFHITTNATLLDDNMISYFSDNNVALTISLDGSKEVHDKNRIFKGSSCGSYDAIINNLKEIKQNHPKYYEKIIFNTVIDPNNDLNCTNNFFSNNDLIKDSIINANLINYNYSKEEQEHKSGDFRQKWEYEKFKLFLSKLGYLEEKDISKLLNTRIDIIKRLLYSRNFQQELDDTNHHGGPCIPGAQRLFVDFEGNLYPCERVSESSQIMKLGSIKQGFDVQKVKKLLNIGKLTERSCKNCWAFRFCGLCAAFADGETELSIDIKLNKCNSTRKVVDEMFKEYCMLREFNYKFEYI